MSEHGNSWATLDKDLNRISRVESATAYVSRPLVGMGIAMAFIVLAWLMAAMLMVTVDMIIVVVAGAAANVVAAAIGIAVADYVEGLPQELPQGGSGMPVGVEILAAAVATDVGAPRLAAATPLVVFDLLDQALPFRLRGDGAAAGVSVVAEAVLSGL
ncbi:MAG: hypothetical protein NWQ32_09500 [Paracoccaceae bacterium]|nr:hypothetical protein [Paracoccaceae bacterium]